MIKELPVLLLILAASSGCGPQPIKAKSGALTQAQADIITAKCGGSKGMLEISDGEFTLRDAQNFKVSACMMKSLDATGVTNFAGRVGNQMYVAPGRQH